MKAMRISLLRIGLLALALFGLSGLASAGEGLFSPSDLPKAKRKANEETLCVEPVEVMRRWHMQLLLHQRDRTMHEGVRTKQHSLVECINCHVDENADIHSKNHFCAACHAYAAVRVDCFECHASTPEPAGGGQQPPPAETVPAAPAPAQAMPQESVGGAQP